MVDLDIFIQQQSRRNSNYEKTMTSKFCELFKGVACLTSEVDFSDIFFIQSTLC